MYIYDSFIFDTILKCYYYLNMSYCYYTHINYSLLVEDIELIDDMIHEWLIGFKHLWYDATVWNRRGLKITHILTIVSEQLYCDV